MLLFSGYMSPEYAMRGQFSVKSDVFSFGVLVLEIVSGKKNTDLNQWNHADDLLSYVSIIRVTFFFCSFDAIQAKGYFNGLGMRDLKV